MAFDLPAQDLGGALRAVAARAGWELYAQSKDVNGVSAPALRGTFTPAEAVEHLLRGTGLKAKIGAGSIMIRGRSRAAQTEEEGLASSDIVVTGTRIIGAPPTAPVTTVTSEDIRNAGQTDLGQVARSLPMDFGGGQNPGVGNTQGSGSINVNVNGASTINLRGIGANATLTLLNGNRLSYSGTGAGIDVSAIPVAAVERMEIVADGASAIYGSDAVAGVVNVILKPDYQGLWTSARIGGATQGGDWEQGVSAVTGTKWSTGGIMAVYDYARNSAIYAGQRSVTSSSNAGTSIYPDILRNDILLTGHQDLTPDLKFTTDLTFKTGHNASTTGNQQTGPITANGGEFRQNFQSFGIAPALSVTLPASWTAKLTGYYGYDNSNGPLISYYGGVVTSNVAETFNNSTWSLEASAQGPLFSLPAGSVRLAIGGGIRRYHYNEILRGVNYADVGRTNHFAYAEGFVPIVAPKQNLPWLYQASLTGAVRVEDYSDSNRIATPKVGLTIQPVKALDLKVSWGRSYKLPTLYQQYGTYAAVLFSAAPFGYPGNSTYIYTLGSNSKDQAEHSENLTLSAQFKPSRRVELTADYFHINYTDRVAAPISNYIGALTNPLYTSLITPDPSAAQQAALIAGATGGLQNGAGAPYNAANVVAIVDGRDQNIAKQLYKGVDLSGRYRVDLGAKSKLDLTGSATWLTSRQQLLPGQPWTQLAGIVFQPAHFKARGGATVTSGAFTLAGFVNYTGGVTDNRITPNVWVHSVTTVDLTAHVPLPGGLDVGLNATNLFDAKPAIIYHTSAYDTAYDTLNYSAIGRFLGLRLSRKW